MNKQITEDYVSYETAVLLKEKGFPQSEYANTLPYYTQNKNLYFGDINTVRQRFYNEAIAPSQSLALKWLREERNLYIEIRRNLNTFYYGWKVEEGMSEKVIFDYKYDSYEKAVEAAIKYTLENLI